MAIPGSPASLLPAGDDEFARRLRDVGRSLTELGPSIAASIKPAMDDIRAQQAITAGLVADLTTAEATLATTVSGLTTAQATTVSTLTAAVADIAALASLDARDVEASALGPPERPRHGALPHVVHGHPQLPVHACGPRGHRGVDGLGELRLGPHVGRVLCVRRGDDLIGGAHGLVGGGHGRSSPLRLCGLFCP